MWSTGGTFSLGDTIGQSDASRVPMTAGGLSLAGGFWPSPAPACTSFAPADFDQDRDVGQADFAVFQRCYSDEYVAPDPSCSQ
jgi:hypothetical protein